MCVCCTSLSVVEYTVPSSCAVDHQHCHYAPRRKYARSSFSAPTRKSIYYLSPCDTTLRPGSVREAGLGMFAVDSSPQDQVVSKAC